MQLVELTQRYPLLYHMAAPGSWESIQRHGLLSTSRLLDLFEVSEHDRVGIEARRRPETVTLQHDTHGMATIRDNKPISDSKLVSALTDMSPGDFYRLLNGKVFFWLTEPRLMRLLGARAYRTSAHTVLTFDSARLLQDYAPSVSLSPINSGATVYRALPRGSNTFQRVENYDFESRRRLRGLGEAIAELAIDDAVYDVHRYVLRVEEHHPEIGVRLLWKPSR